MISSVGENHLRAVFSQTIRHSPADKAVTTENCHNIAGEGGSAASATLHGCQVYITGLNLSVVKHEYKYFRKLLNNKLTK